jgi:pimeloyl-ACP methyl ester carboxylesterase
MKLLNQTILASLVCICTTFISCKTETEIVVPPTQMETDAKLTPATPPTGFTSKFATVNGVRLHYVQGGTGSQVVVLLHGWPETWYEWHRVMPELAKTYTVIAPDLRGIGESDKTLLPDGFDKRTLAADLNGLIQSLGYSRINLIGHDIGQMVAYDYAAIYPNNVRKLVVMDAPIPGIEPFWTGLLQDARSWHFGFYGNDGAAAARTIGTNVRDYLTDFIKKFSGNPTAFTAEEINEIARVYSQKGALESSFGWYKAVYTKDVAQHKELSKTKLTMPILAMGGEYSGSYMFPMYQLLGNNVEEAVIKGSGHWIVQEQPQQFLDKVIPFLAK